jgi:hypothetical protein
MFQTKVVEKVKTYFMFNYFFLKNRTVYEIMWKNILELTRPRMAIWRMCIACGLAKATSTLSEYVMLIAFPLQSWLGELASMLRLT